MFCMRTTLTLDDDISVQITRIREERKMSLRDTVNVAMRMGLMQMVNATKTKRKAYKTPVFHATRCSVGNLTSTAEMLAVAEGENHR